MLTGVPILNKHRFERSRVADDERLVDTINGLIPTHPHAFALMCDPDLNLLLLVKEVPAGSQGARPMLFIYQDKRPDGREFSFPIGQFPQFSLSVARHETENLKEWQDAGIRIEQLHILRTERV